MKWTKIQTIVDAGRRWYARCDVWVNSYDNSHTIRWSNGPRDTMTLHLSWDDCMDMPNWLRIEAGLTMILSTKGLK